MKPERPYEETFLGKIGVHPRSWFFVAVPSFVIVVGLALLLPAPGPFSPQAAQGACLLVFGLVLIGRVWRRITAAVPVSVAPKLRFFVILGLFVGSIEANHWENSWANDRGWASASERRDALAAGYSTSATYRKYLQLERRNDAAALRAAKTYAQAAEVDCRQDLNCWGNRHISTGVYCEDHIERLAQYSHQWTDGFLESKFSRFRWKDQSAGTLTLIGDKIQFQNGLGAWQNHTYQCDIDPETNTVLGVRASPGRLPPG